MERVADLHKEGFIEVEGGRVWYEILGDKSKVPLIVLHGGPGSSCLSMRPLGVLQDERPVGLYDQLGCGKSDRPTDPTLWMIDRFVRELAELRRTLGLDRVHILGHSWGTMLLADYLLTQPQGVVSAIFSSPCLSAPMWMKDAMKYRRELPEDVQAVLDACEAEGRTDSEEYEKAAEVYLKKHVCRVEVPKAERELRKAAFGKEVYNAMWGPSEFYATGNLKNYDRTQRLHEIQVPALFICGRYDEASPESTAYYHSLVPGSEFVVLEESSHSPLREQPETYIRLIRDFLNRVEEA
jgi:proline iminopeptidase